MRRIPLALLSASYEQLLDGRSEWSVCVDLEVMPEAFEGVLQSALEEALWERGYFRRSRQIENLHLAGDQPVAMIAGQFLSHSEQIQGCKRIGDFL